MINLTPLPSHSLSLGRECLSPGGYLCWETRLLLGLGRGAHFGCVRPCTWMCGRMCAHVWSHVSAKAWKSS